jgi:hypothetical protein
MLLALLLMISNDARRPRTPGSESGGVLERLPA